MSNEQLASGMTLAMTLFMIALVIIMRVVLRRLPLLTRPSIFFSITVSPSFRGSEQALAMVRRYQQRIRRHTIIALCLAFSAGALALALNPVLGLLMIVLLPIGWQSGGMIAALQEARRQVRPHAVRPSGVREALLRTAPAQSHGLARRLLLVLPLFVVAAGAMYLGLRWDEIPQRFPIHWDASGEADGWATRTPAGVFGPLLLGLLMYGSVVLLYPFLRRARRISASGAAAERESRFRAFWQLVVLAMGNLVVAISTALAVWLPFRAEASMPAGFITGIIALTLLGSGALIVISLRQGQGGQQLELPQASAREESQGQRIGDGTPDEAWLAGLFYCNRNDPAVMVERRFGIGWDFNWGNPAAWLAMLIVVLITALGVVAALLMTSSAAGSEMASSGDHPSASQLVAPE